MRSNKQSGLSLVELMIALVLGLIVIAAVAEVFVANKKMYRVQDAWSRLQENGRFAMQQITSSIRNAGYMGCSSLSGLTVTNTLNNSTTYSWNFSEAINGFNATGTNTWSPTLDASISAMSGSDVFTIRGASQPAVLVTQHPGGTPPGSANIQVNTGNKLDDGDIVMVTDCINAAIFQITSANPDTSGSISHNTGKGTPGNSTQALGKNYEGAEIYKITTTSFYIKDNNGVPTLYKKETSNNSAIATEIIPYVEDMQIEYGVDTNADSSVDSYQLASGVADWGNVLSVKIQLLLRSEDDYLTVDGGKHTVYFNGTSYSGNDQRLRAAFSQIVTLRNRIP